MHFNHLNIVLLIMFCFWSFLHGQLLFGFLVITIAWCCAWCRQILFVVVLVLSVVMMCLKGWQGPWYRYLFRFVLLFSYIIPLRWVGRPPYCMTQYQYNGVH